MIYHGLQNIILDHLKNILNGHQEEINKKGHFPHYFKRMSIYMWIRSIPEKGQRWRAFNTDRVISEIDYMVKKYEINHVEIEDDNCILEKSCISILKYFHN